MSADQCSKLEQTKELVCPECYGRVNRVGTVLFNGSGMYECSNAACGILSWEYECHDLAKRPQNREGEKVL